MAIHKHFMLSCNICNKSFYDQKHLDEHYITHTEVINTYDCYQCPKKFLQKYQLEGHLQLHNITSNEPTAKKKKSVHFSSILETRNIDDFLDKEYSSDEDSNFVNKTTATRSGRLVKPKKLFENEQKVKRKYNKKNKESHSKIYTNVKDDPKLKPTSVQNSNAETIKHIHKELRVISEKIPYDVLCAPAETEYIHKELRVISEKIPDVLFKEYIAKGNVCNYKALSRSNCDPECIQSSSLKSLSNDICRSDEEISPSRKNIQCTQIFPSSGITINPDNSELSKKLKEKNETSTNQQTVNASDNLVTLVTSPQSEQLKKNGSNDSNIISSDKSKLPNKPKKNYQSFKLPPSCQKVISNVLNPKVSQVGNRYVYIGANPDFNKIQKVIEKAKAMSKSTGSPVLETNNQVANKISPTVPNCAVPVKQPSNNVCHKSSASKKGNLNKNLHDSKEDGILDKTMVEEILLVKVTPQYMMQKMKENMTSKKSIPPDLSAANTQKTKMVVEASKTISPKVIDISSNSNVNASDGPLASDIGNSEIETSNKGLKNQLQNFTSPTESISYNLSPPTYSKNTQKTKMILDASKTISRKVNDISSNSNVNTSADAPLASDSQNSETVTSDNGGIKANLDASQAFSSHVTEQIKMAEDQCNEIASQKGIIKFRKEGEQYTSDELEYLNVLSSKEKIFQKYIAKLKEKEHKKKEKYELKKKAKYELKKKAKYELKKKAKYELKKEERKKNIAMKMKLNKKKLDKLNSSNKDPYSIAPTVTNENIAIRSPCNSKDCSDSSLHMNYVPNDDNATKKSSRSKQGETDEATKKAIQDARDISEKFNKNLNEAQHLKLLSELDHLVTKFNIAGKCLFLSPIIRFCRLYVDSYKVKEQAVSLGKKLAIIKTK